MSLSNLTTLAESELFYTRGDKDDPRLGEIVKPVRADFGFNENDFVILGYPDDEGIRLNGGRPGAAHAPFAIRQSLYKRTPSLSGTPLREGRLLDIGNLKIEGGLTDRHQKAEELVQAILSKGSRVLTLGGGHDYGYPDFAAFCEVVLSEKKKPFIINFDAHLDVRPDNSSPHSGTPFFKLLKKYGDKTDFFEVGIQDWCNSHAHKLWAADHGAHILTLSEISDSQLSLSEIVSQKILSKFTKNHVLGLSVDIDGFSSAVAPGASQVFPVGLDAQEFLSLWKSLARKYQPRIAGLYEVSPPLDQDQRTAHFAGILAHQYFPFAQS